MAETTNDDYITIVEGENEKHVYFHGAINRLSAFNLCTNLTGIDLLIREGQESKEFGFQQSLDKEVKEESKPKEKIILHLNCPGGLVQHAFIIANTIETLDTDIECIVEGNLASSGIIVLLSCKDRRMQRHSKIYFHETIHGVESIKFSELATFQKDSKESYNTLRNYYNEKTKMSMKQITKFLQTEKIIGSKEAYELGFITSED